MKDQVFMSPNNGQLVVGVPLFRYIDHELGVPGYSISLVNHNKPLAYIIDADKLMTPQVLAAEWIESHMINLGEL